MAAVILAPLLLAKRLVLDNINPGAAYAAPGFSFPPGENLLHGVLVGLDHLLDHLAADGAGFTGGQVAVVALLQVDADLL